MKGKENEEQKEQIADNTTDQPEEPVNKGNQRTISFRCKSQEEFDYYQNVLNACKQSDPAYSFRQLFEDWRNYLNKQGFYKIENT